MANMEISARWGNITVSVKSNGETVDDFCDLASTVLSWGAQQPIDCVAEEDEDDAIYCEGEEPTEERVIDGL